MTTVTKTLRIIDIINLGVDHFIRMGVENPRREMEWLLCNVLSCERIDLYLKFENYITGEKLKKIRSMVKRRVSGEPFQHIIERGTFYGRDYIVNSHVFIPRPETGLLIDRLKKNGAVSKLLEVGTGSGCIAITCALENLAENIFVTDISSNALNIVRKNMQLHSVNHIQVSCHNILNKGFKTKFDVVISNPPYIRLDEMDSLQIEVRDYDPKIALTDGDDGLVFYRRFAGMFDDLITPRGYMLLEIGGDSHKQSIEKIFSDIGLQVKFYRDFQGNFRTAEVRR